MSVLDRTSPVPLYHQLERALAARLKNGEFELGVPLPTEAELVSFYNVSRITVRRAMHELEREGQIVRIPGKGTFVTEPKIGRGLTRLTSFTEDMRERGLATTSELLDLRQEPASAHVAEKLGVESGAPVWFVHRLRLANQQPLALNLSYLHLPPHLSIITAELADNDSLWALLERKGIGLTDADKTLEAILADQEYARLLRVPVGAPLLLVEGVAYDHRHTPIEYSQVVNRGDRYKYTLHLKR